jgi:hypothetical protein
MYMTTETIKAATVTYAGKITVHYSDDGDFDAAEVREMAARMERREADRRIASRRAADLAEMESDAGGRRTAQRRLVYGELIEE